MRRAALLTYVVLGDIPTQTWNGHRVQNVARKHMPQVTQQPIACRCRRRPVRDEHRVQRHDSPRMRDFSVVQHLLEQPADEKQR